MKGKDKKMEIGDRVTPKDKFLRLGTVLSTNGQSIGVKWDKGNGEIMRRDQLYIVGHDPKVSGEKGVWHEREKESVRLRESFNRDTGTGW